MKNRIKRCLPFLLAVMMTMTLFTVPVGADSTVDSYPSVFHMKIDGTPVVGETLTFSYDLYNPDNQADALDESKLEWQVQDTQYIGATSGGYTEIVRKTGGTSYTITADDVDKYIAVRVPVKTVTGNGRMRTIGVGPILAATPAAPAASSVTIENDAIAAGVTVGEPVEGHYLYAGQNAEGNSEYSWALAASGENGTYTPIAGATEKTYIPKAEDMKKWLRFTVTPVDSEGNKGEPVHSVTRPIVGSASYGAHVSGNGNCYKGMMVNGITNGLESNPTGAIYTYGADNDPDVVVDLGETRVLSGVRIASNGANPADGIRMFSSLTGGKTEFTPLHTKEYAGDAGTEELVLFGDGGRQTVDFSKPTQARFVQVNIQKTKSISLQELTLYEALPTGLSAAAKSGETLSVAQDATEAEVREVVAEKLTITATYDGDVTAEIPLDKAAIELDTTGGGTKDMKISYKELETTVSVQVDGNVELQSLTAEKAKNYTKDVTVFTGATEAELRTVLNDAGVSLTAAYSDGSTKTPTLDDENVTIALNETDQKCTITYRGATAELTVKVADKKQPPNVYGLWIEGAPVEGETLTLHYTLDDPNGVAGNVVDNINWHMLDVPYNNTKGQISDYTGVRLKAVGTQTYTIPADGSLQGKYIHAAITMPEKIDNDVLYRCGWDRKATIAIGPIQAAKSATPAVSTVTISSMGMDGGRGVGANVGQTLRGDYYYIGAEAEGESTYQWWSSSDETTGFAAIDGATQREYTVTEADRGKYLKFTVTPKDKTGAAGTAEDSINRPMAGNAAYLAMATEALFGAASGNNNGYRGNNTQVLTNGISDWDKGGLVMTTMDSKTEDAINYPGMVTVDLGKTQTLTGARLAMENATNQDTVSFYTSPDGLYWYPAETAEGLELLSSGFLLKTNALGKGVTFKTPVQARYLQMRHTRKTNNRITELQAFVQETEPALSSIAAAKSGAALKVKQGTDAAAVQAYLAENVTVTATYAGVTNPITLVPEAATYTLDTAEAGAAVNATVSFRGQTTTIPVEVEALELKSIAVAKAAGVTDIKVPLNTNAAGLKDLLADKIVITATYEDDSTKTIDGADAEYSATTSAAGTVDATVSYGGKTATVPITVEAKELTGIAVAKASGVTDINVWQNTDAAGLKTALADKIVITATYSDSSTETVANEEAAYSADTSATGAVNVTVSYGGKTATVSINVQAVTLSAITVAKVSGVTDIKVPQNTGADDLKTLLADKIVITGTYSDGSTKTIANADVNYSGNTAAEGAATVTVSYGGQTATISVTVEAVVTLTGITVANAPGVNTIEVVQGTDAAGLKNLLANKIVITAHYSNGTTETIANADAAYSADTAAVGAATVTVTYQGQTATLPIIVAAPVTAADVNPSLFGMRITGTPVAGETLTFEYDLYDPKNKEPNLLSKISWRQQDKPDFELTPGNLTEKTLQTGTLTYTIPNDSSLVGKYISVNVQIEGLANGVRCRTMGIGPILAAVPETPEASSVVIIPAPGGAKAGCDSSQTMMGDYLYTGAQPEGASTYQWYIATNPNGPFTAIEGATERYYTPRSADYKKYLQFRVTPADTAGTAGKEAASYNLPRIGNVAYRAYVNGSPNSYQGRSLIALTNGVYDNKGGGVCTYMNKDRKDRTSVILDIGAVRTLVGITATATNSNADDGVALEVSVTGDKDSFIPVHTADFEGTEEEVIYYSAGDVTFAQPVQARYVKVKLTQQTNVRLTEVELFAAQDKEPVITLTGGDELKLLRGETFVEPGFTAIDEEDGDLTKNVTVTGTVDTNTVGTYELTYTVTDSKPQTVRVVRRVTVADGYHADGDLAYGKTVTADGENAASLVDGNKFTDWQAGSTTSSAVIDLGGEQTVSNAVLMENGSAVTGYVIEVSKDGSAWQTAHTGAAIGAQQSVDFEPVSGRYVRLRFTGASAAPKMATFEIRFDDLGKVKEALAALTIGGNLDAVTEDLALPNKGLHGAVITWESDNAAAVTDRGIVHRGRDDQNAVLRATVTIGEISLTKEFPVKVLKSTGGTGGGIGGGGGAGGGRGDATSTIQVPSVQPNIPVTPQPNVTSGKFKDVADSHWAKNYIENLGSRGIVNGKENGAFDAEGVVTRAEFLKMIVEIFGLQAETPSAAFSDVQEGDWYYHYVATASALGVAQGMGDGSFGAGAPITRQDMAVLVARAATAADKTLGEAGDLSRFTDAAEVGDYAAEALAQLVGAGIVGGDDKGALNPINNATRAEAAKILCLVSNQVQG